MSSKFEFSPIGYIKSAQVEPYQAARQPDELSEPATIELEAGQNFEQALQDLDGCTHIWLLYVFHKNENWKPLVQTPRSDKKIGVFATRAPYRPNPIGMTVVPLIEVNKLKIKVGPNDLLDGTPILDIKPYHPESDLIEEAKINWLESSLPAHEIAFSPLAEDQIDFLETNGLGELRPFILRQLEYDPLNSDKKRVESIGPIATLSYRTWRIDFIITDLKVSVLSIRTGYEDDDLTHEKHDDPYGDKALHLKFTKNF